MKIAYIVLKGIPFGGGIEKYTEEVGARLAGKGHDIVVYAMGHYGTSCGWYRGMRIKIVPALRNKHLEKMTASFMATIVQALDKNVDIVHFHAFGPAMFCFIPRLFGRKVVVQGHGLEWQRSRWKIGIRAALRLVEIPSVRLANTLTVVSRVQQRYLCEKYKVDSVYIPTGVNLPQRGKPDLIKQYGLQGSDYILFAARLVQEKGAHYLIEAYKRLKTDLKLIIAGDIEHEAEYKSMLYKLSKGNRNIIFTGFVTGRLLSELFSNCYMFVLPSEIEGLPIALLEAMSYGNCCIVSDIPENLEALNNFGYVFKNKNIDGLTEKMKYLINDKNAAETVKQKAQSYVLENYSWDNITEQFEELYRKLLAS